MTGTIKKIIADKGFGFIEREGQKPGDKDLFFHRDSVTGVPFEELREGDSVSFEEEANGERTKAVGVQRADKQEQAA